jgi:CRP-like cAMP-binding protein
MRAAGEMGNEGTHTGLPDRVEIRLAIPHARPAACDKVLIPRAFIKGTVRAVLRAHSCSDPGEVLAPGRQPGRGPSSIVIPSGATSGEKGPVMAPENLLLAALPPGVLEHLQPRLEPVPLPKGRALFEAGEAIRHAYFPTSGLVSLLGTTADGESVELATVATDGLLGLPLILHADAAPHAATVQMAGSALRIHARDLDVALRQSVVLHSVLLHYTHGLLVEISQAVVCHHFHSDLPRLCRWLLIAMDRLHCQTLDVTHDALALAIGVPRTQVTCAALELQDAGAIRYRRGRIHILNRRRLELSACECYHAQREGVTAPTAPSPVRWPTPASAVRA